MPDFVTAVLIVPIHWQGKMSCLCLSFQSYGTHWPLLLTWQVFQYVFAVCRNHYDCGLERLICDGDRVPDVQRSKSASLSTTAQEERPGNPVEAGLGEKTVSGAARTAALQWAGRLRWKATPVVCVTAASASRPLAQTAARSRSALFEHILMRQVDVAILQSKCACFPLVLRFHGQVETTQTLVHTPNCKGNRIQYCTLKNLRSRLRGTQLRTVVFYCTKYFGGLFFVRRWYSLSIAFLHSWTWLALRWQKNNAFTSETCI